MAVVVTAATVEVVVIAAVAVVAPVRAVLEAGDGVQPCRQHSTDCSQIYPILRHCMATGPCLGDEEWESGGDCQLGHGEGGF